MIVTDEPKEADVARGLLTHLRTVLQQPELAYAEPPTRVTGGFDTMIYGFRLRGATEEWSAPLILRAFRQDNDPVRARWEGAVQTAVVQLGYPAPRVLLTSTDKETIGAPFIIMERLPGKMMLEDVFNPSRLLLLLPYILTEVPTILVETQTKLHALDPEPLLQALDAEGLSRGGVAPAGASRRMPTVDGQVQQIQRRIEDVPLDGLKPGLQWISEHRPPEPDQRVICHGDFHPLNVLMKGRAVSGVIDWAMVTVAAPEFDVANTKLILELAPMDFPLILEQIARVAKPLLARRYYDAYRRRRALDSEAVHYYEALRCVVELTWVGECQLSDAGVPGLRSAPSPWQASRPSTSLITRFRKITGITLTLPTSPA
jgi:aminoglycoside phosphotransferase (APT) family kinase protein